MKSRYINTDLVLRSKGRMDGLVEHFDRMAEVLMYDRYTSNVWMALVNGKGSGMIDDPKSTPQRDIRNILHAIGKIDGALEKEWRRCYYRELNIGWASAEGRPEGSITLRPDVTARIAQCGLSLWITVYPSGENDL